MFKKKNRQRQSKKKEKDKKTKKSVTTDRLDIYFQIHVGTLENHSLGGGGVLP